MAIIGAIFLVTLLSLFDILTPEVLFIANNIWNVVIFIIGSLTIVLTFMKFFEIDNQTKI